MRRGFDRLRFAISFVTIMMLCGIAHAQTAKQVFKLCVVQGVQACNLGVPILAELAGGSDLALAGNGHACHGNETQRNVHHPGDNL